MYKVTDNQHCICRSSKRNRFSSIFHYVIHYCIIFPWKIFQDVEYFQHWLDSLNIFNASLTIDERIMFFTLQIQKCVSDRNVLRVIKFNTNFTSLSIRIMNAISMNNVRFFFVEKVNLKSAFLFYFIRKIKKKQNEYSRCSNQFVSKLTAWSQNASF